jgi:hypothetical protein
MAQRAAGGAHEAARWLADAYLDPTLGSEAPC